MPKTPSSQEFEKAISPVIPWLLILVIILYGIAFFNAKGTKLPSERTKINKKTNIIENTIQNNSIIRSNQVKSLNTITDTIKTQSQPKSVDKPFTLNMTVDTTKFEYVIYKNGNKIKLNLEIKDKKWNDGESINYELFVEGERVYVIHKK